MARCPRKVARDRACNGRREICRLNVGTGRWRLKKAVKLLPLLALASLVHAPWVLAGGFTIIEMGVKKTGMMTSIAKPDDLSAVYHNPAGLADQHGTRLHLSSGFSFVDAKVRLKAWPGGEGVYGSEDFISTPVDDEGYFEGWIRPTRYFGAMPMFVASSDFGWEDGPVWAFSMFVPDFIGAFLPEDAPTRYMVVEGYFVAGVACLSGAWRLPAPYDFLSVGAGIGALYVRIAGSRWLNVNSLLEYNTDFKATQAAEDWRPFYNLGITADLPLGITLGLSFIGGADVNLEGRLDIELAPGQEKDPILDALGLQVEGNYRMRQTMKVPAGLAFGINWEVFDRLELGFDLRWWFYSVFDKSEIFHNIDVQLGGQPLVENPMVLPKDYEDSWTVSLGALGRPFDVPLELMAGWSYDHSPAPTRTKSLDSPSTNLTGFSLGARYTLFGRYRLSLTYYRYWYLKDTVDDSILDPPQNSQYVGSVDTVSVEAEIIF
ncbi:MAG: hypothetical protein D6806_03440 [Deltaproteobacteria bacterium]|nr:MAG: hypothetical protein D6806_03440 [Deltaproteobacteria bacterium]